MSRDHRVHDFNLAAVIGLSGRPVPEDFYVEFLPGRIGAGMDSLPEHVRGAFRNNCYLAFLLAVTRRYQ